MPKAKPKKPYPDFPLTPHPRGQWCKKIKGKLYYFGSIDDPDAAVRKYLENKERLQAGLGMVVPVQLTLADLVNLFLASADEKRATGELSNLSFRDYKSIGEQILSYFGRNTDPQRMGPTDFAGYRNWILSQYTPAGAGKKITVCKMIFRWGYEYEHLESMPRFGRDFKGASKRSARIAKAASSGKMLEAAEIRSVMAATDPQFRTMILLGINCGFGNNDVSELRWDNVDLKTGWVEFPRPKTGINRRCPLWPESLTSLKALPQSDDRVFTTRTGEPFVVIDDEGKRTDKITLRFRKLLKKAEANRKGVGFYSLRHTFQTIGDETRDPVAVSSIMGHSDPTMAGHYRERISDERLKAVTDHVHRWLFAEGGDK